MESNQRRRMNQNTALPITNPNGGRSGKKLPVSSVKTTQNIIFSYKYFSCECLKNNDFNNCFKDINDYATWFTFCLKRISEFSTMSIAEIGGAGKATRFHPVEKGDLNKLKEILKSMNLDVEKIFSQDESNNYYELSFGTANGRMFGYLVENIYYVLLMDPNHLVYICVERGAKQDLLHKRYNPWDELLGDTNDLRR